MTDLTEHAKAALADAEAKCAVLIDEFGPDAAAEAMRTSLASRPGPSGEAERLIVRAYRDFLAAAPRPPGRGVRTGRYGADLSFNQGEFLRQHGEYLSDPRHTAGDVASRNKKALQRLLKKYPEELLPPAEGH